MRGSGIPSTLCCGRRQSQGSPRGTVPGDPGGQAGISSNACLACRSLKSLRYIVTWSPTWHLHDLCAWGRASKGLEDFQLFSGSVSLPYAFEAYHVPCRDSKHDRVFVKKQSLFRLLHRLLLLLYLRGLWANRCTSIEGKCS